MRYYLDTEFDEERFELISIGVVAQDGREFYAVNSSYDTAVMSEWLRENVAPHLFHNSAGLLHAPLSRIAEAMWEFLGQDYEVQFWAYVADYDYVLLRRMMMSAGLEGQLPLLCYDLKQLAVSCGVKESLKLMVKPFEPQHNALADARWTKHVHEQIILQYEREI